MARIQTRDLEQILPLLPDVEPLTGLPAKMDLFVCALGFEPRCLSLPRKLRELGARAGACVHMELDTNVSDNRVNLQDLTSVLDAISSRVVLLNADTAGFEHQLSEIIGELSGSLGRAPIVVFDISVAANRMLLRALKVLLESQIELCIAYTEAEIYHPTQAEFESDIQKWTDEEILGTEIGVSSIVPSAEYAGQHLDPLPDCVILFPTFRKERSLAVICRVDETLVTTPRDNVLWVLGVPGAPENKWRTNATKLANAIPEHAPQFAVSTFDYRETLAILERIHRERWLRFNLTISPLGSKLQAVGIGLFCYLRPDVKLMFAAPRKYNAAEWSSGAGKQWKIELGKTVALREMLRAVGEISIS